MKICIVIINIIISDLEKINQYKQKVVKSKKRSVKECLLPSYVTSINKKNSVKNIDNSAVMIVNNSNNNKSNSSNATTTATNTQQQIDSLNNVANIASVRIYKEETVLDTKLPPWIKKNTVQNQLGRTISNSNYNNNNNNRNAIQSSVISAASASTQNVIPIFQINGQMIAIDQQGSQSFNNQSQQIQMIEQNMKNFSGEKAMIRSRQPPNFKDDPTAYLNQQTALLQNTITTLKNPDRKFSSNNVSPLLQNNPSSLEFQQRTQQRQIIQQLVKTPNSSIDGKITVHSNSDEIVHIQNCDTDKMQQHQLEPEQQQNKAKTNQKGRPKSSKRLVVAVSHESPVSSSTSSAIKLIKSHTPDITSSSEGISDAILQHLSNSENTESAKFTHNFLATSSSQDVMHSTLTLAGNPVNLTTVSSNSSNNSHKKATIVSTSTMKKPPTQIITQFKNSNNNSISNNINQQVMVAANGQQYIVMPSSHIQTQPQNIHLVNNAVVQLQNANPNINQRLIPGQNGNILIQTNNGNVLSGNSGNFIVNGQSIILQNGQIIQNNGLMTSSKNNIIVTGSNNSSPKALITGNNHIAFGQQTVLLQNNILPQPTLTNDSSFLSSVHQQPQHSKIILNHEKKKGRKRKLPNNEQSNLLVSISIFIFHSIFNLSLKHF